MNYVTPRSSPRLYLNMTQSYIYDYMVVVLAMYYLYYVCSIVLLYYVCMYFYCSIYTSLIDDKYRYIGIPKISNIFVVLTMGTVNKLYRCY